MERPLVDSGKSLELIKQWYHSFLNVATDDVTEMVIIHDGLSSEVMAEFPSITFKDNSHPIISTERSSVDDVRFYEYHAYLNEMESLNRFQIVLTTNIRDFKFRMDPFQNLDSRLKEDGTALYIDHGVTNRDHGKARGGDFERWVSNRLSKCSGDLADESMKWINDNPDIAPNPAIIGGRPDIVQKLFGEMVAQFDKFSPKEEHCNFGVLTSSLHHLCVKNQKCNVVTNDVTFRGAFEIKKGFALISANFGDFRGETNGINKKLERFAKFEIDSFFFTDSNIGNVNGWDIVHVDLQEDQNEIPGGRLNTKMIKFEGHQVLHSYRYLIWMDSNEALQHSHDFIEKCWLEHVQQHPESALFALKNAHGATQKEINVLQEPRLHYKQPQAALQAWDKFLRREPGYAEINKAPLMHTEFFVLDTSVSHSEFVKAWKTIPSIMVEHGIWRDQIVHAYALRALYREIEYLPHPHRVEVVDNICIEAADREDNS